MRLVLILLAVTACVPQGERGAGQCPVGETCAATPTSLGFLPPAFYDGETPLWYEPAIVIGGKTSVVLEYEETFTSPAVPINFPYAAADGGGPAVVVAGALGATVTLAGAAPGSNELRIVDPSDGTLYDRKLYTAAAVAQIEIAPITKERTATTELAYAKGTSHFGIELYDAAHRRMVDTSLQISGGTHPAWDIAAIAAAAGTHTLAVTTGGVTTTFPLVVADHADTVVAIDPPAAVPVGGYAVEVCFGAMLGATSVINFAWSFTVDGAPAPAEARHPDCVAVGTLQNAGTIAVQATAGGATTTLMLPIGS